MAFVLKRGAVPVLVLLVSITAPASDKEPEKFRVQAASSYAHHQTSEKVTVAADVIETDEQARPAFGKKNPYAAGVLPVLVVIQNDTGKTLKVNHLKVEYAAADGERIENTPASDLRYLHGARQPKMTSGPIPGVGKIGKSKAPPLSNWEIEGRAFSATVIPPGESASGFFYFQTGHRSNSTLYVSGLKDASTGQELVFFEIPLAPVQ